MTERQIVAQLRFVHDRLSAEVERIQDMLNNPDTDCRARLTERVHTAPRHEGLLGNSTCSNDEHWEDRSTGEYLLLRGLYAFLGDLDRYVENLQPETVDV